MRNLPRFSLAGLMLLQFSACLAHINEKLPSQSGPTFLPDITDNLRQLDSESIDQREKQIAFWAANGPQLALRQEEKHLIDPKTFKSSTELYDEVVKRLVKVALLSQDRMPALRALFDLSRDGQTICFLADCITNKGACFNESVLRALKFHLPSFRQEIRTFFEGQRSSYVFTAFQLLYGGNAQDSNTAALTLLQRNTPEMKTLGAMLFYPDRPEDYINAVKDQLTDDSPRVREVAEEGIRRLTASKIKIAYIDKLPNNLRSILYDICLTDHDDNIALRLIREQDPEIVAVGIKKLSATQMSKLSKGQLLEYINRGNANLSAQTIPLLTKFSGDESLAIIRKSLLSEIPILRKATLQSVNESPALQMLLLPEFEIAAAKYFDYTDSDKFLSNLKLANMTQKWLQSKSLNLKLRAIAKLQKSKDAKAIVAALNNFDQVTEQDSIDLLFRILSNQSSKILDKLRDLADRATIEGISSSFNIALTNFDEPSLKYVRSFFQDQRIEVRVLARRIEAQLIKSEQKFLE